MRIGPRLCALLLLPLGSSSVFAAPAGEPAPQVQAIVDRAAQSALERFRDKHLESSQLAITLIDLTSASAPRQGNVRGEDPIYPASVVKLFYLAAAHAWMEAGKLQDTPELRRAMRDMIVDSSNDATSYIVDLLTGTTSGPELPEPELKTWFEKREAVNRYFAGLGYTGINVNMKPWGDGPYGRETQAAQTFERKRNQLTTNATARLLAAIATGQCVTADRSKQMMELLFRDSAHPDEQAQFIAAALPPGARQWSKAGWTSQTRHIAAYVELPGGQRFVLVIFTTGHAKDLDILPAIAKDLVAALSSPSSR